MPRDVYRTRRKGRSVAVTGDKPRRFLIPRTAVLHPQPDRPVWTDRRICPGLEALCRHAA